MLARKVNNTRVFRVTTKIVLAFTLFILISNFASNYINLILNRSELLRLMNQLLIKDLKSMYSFCNNQYEIYAFDRKLEDSIKSIEDKGLNDIKNEKAVVLGIKRDGAIFFQSSKFSKYDTFNDISALKAMAQHLESDSDAGKEGHINFYFNGEEYFGIFKYNPKWDIFILRAEEKNEFFRESRLIFAQVSALIIAITLLTAIIGIVILRRILKYINVITDSIMNMIARKELTLINLEGATNDDVTYMGVAFNSLANTVGNLVNIFQKFANQDVVRKAYNELEVKLEGTKRELTVLFSDIKSFTYITETLGNDIIKLLNMHYDRAIREIVKLDGVIGSIIGDALLAVFGALDDSNENKSYQAVKAAYKLHEVAELLRLRMERIKAEVEEEKGKLTKEELQVYKAVLLEIGVGIDGGNVFYGTIGSYVRMTNTVIGDNVNSASRLEGLTRIYKAPVICSEYVKQDIEENVPDHGIYFLEIDRVMVKGKTRAQKIYWPIMATEMDEKLKKDIESFEYGLELYYAGKWVDARKKFARCSLKLADIFKERTSQKCPSNWDGVWQMTTK
ncbi:MAG TPA: adenylate/guanylate cyclase domain-containing protein [Spirochaetota bacterium]|nr:adenylate/guanylate cyclase domain-containing protein [Spirochaetota bacterium]OQA97206.1 MAG: Adenylate cyclase 1 [Spirochaetes bacterium ADurb.Bin218]HOK01904.1 adenylate/guanylate cyclase domain-containing protein [Spirochaetota bacterium]HOK93640.1 adenylate/guanylate cyclase domain-containing protein [Spirochaetota bacterium]HON16443.1 adenylate/guanylate cyclase domain-containing protein [Spirochaetota bacterium]